MPAADEQPRRAEARLLLVSNRLPITIKRSADGKYEYSMSSGGLVSGLSGLSKTTTFQWYGWPGLEIPPDEAEGVTKKLEDEYKAVPVFIDDELADKHYNGFSSELNFIPMSYGGADHGQTLSCGHCSTTILVKSPSTKLLGKLTPKRIDSLPKQLQRMCSTVI